MVEREKMKLTLVENSRDREFSLTSAQRPPLVPHNYLEHMIVVNLEPQGGKYTLGKRQEEPVSSFKSSPNSED